MFKYMPSKHAEMDAIDKISTWKNMPRTFDMLVIRLTKSGMLSESRPCWHCINYIKQSRFDVRNVYYSNKDGFIEREKFRDMELSARTYISSGVRNNVVSQINRANGVIVKNKINSRQSKIKPK